MIEPELDRHLKKIEKDLSHIEKESKNSAWTTLWHGFIYGAGYVIGAIFIIVIAGWILNVVGVIPAFDRQVAALKTALETVR